MRPDADSIAAFLTFIRRRYSMFEARQRGEKLDEASPILKNMHFTNIHRYVSAPKRPAGQLMGDLTLFGKEFSQISVVIVFASVNYECREVDSGTRYLRRRLVGRSNQEQLLMIIVFRTINRSSLLF